MKYFIISDTHLNHEKIKTYCDRPANFTELILRRWNERVTPKDTVIHLGDVAIGHKSAIGAQIRQLNGRKILVRGNHDLHSSCSWWCDEGGFDFACDGMIFRGLWMSHKPAKFLPERCNLNIHGHLHNVWGGFHSERIKTPGKLDKPWQRLFSLEYSNYYPIELNNFVDHPQKYQATGPNR